LELVSSFSSSSSSFVLSSSSLPCLVVFIATAFRPQWLLLISPLIPANQ
jgi:hypothetical protein